MGPEVPALDQGEGPACCCIRLKYALCLLVGYSLLYRDSFPSLLVWLNQQFKIKLDLMPYGAQYNLVLVEGFISLLVLQFVVLIPDFLRTTRLRMFVLTCSGL